MSSDLGQWPVVAPGFMYIVKMGDYTHVLQAADQQSSGHLNLTQSAIRDINVARGLLNERGPFLLSEKQQKMDETITDTEEAINRVVRLLEPARVEHISKESIRFNTQNPWALSDNPKSAATFGRLQITHDKLKTVVHDLNNIEATAQLDDCNTRASNAITPTARRQSMPDALLTSTPQDSRQLLTWKRSRKSHRQGQDSNVSSVSGLTADEHESSDILSPVSAHVRSPGTPADLRARAEIPNVARSTSMSVPKANPLLNRNALLDDSSDVSADRLPIIHELEGASFVSLGRIHPGPITSAEQARTVLDTRVPARSQALPAASRSKIVNGNQAGDLPPPDPVAVVADSQAPKQSTKLKRDTFEDYRRRDRESKQAPGHSLVQHQEAPVVNPPAPSKPQSQFLGRFRSLNARHAKPPLVQTNLSSQTNRFVGNQSPPQNPATQAQRTQPDNPALAPGVNSSKQSATYPPIQTQALQTRGDQPALLKSPNGVNMISPGPMLSPSRTQQSPQEQLQSPQIEQPNEPVRLQPHQRNPQIFSIDPELTKMPSILRPARSRQSELSRPVSVTSEAHSDKRDELYLGETTPLQPPRDALGRPITAPPLMSGLVGQNTHDISEDISVRDDYAHQRSMSDTVVPQINVIRAPTIPRKPLPLRVSASSSRNPSPSEVSRANSPLQRRPQSEVIHTQSELQQIAKNVSGPPSPIRSEHPNALAPPRSRAASVHSLSVQAPSSAGSSRRSSVSAEDPGGKSSPVQERPMIKNPLAMNPPDIPERVESAYQAQSRVVTLPSTQPPVMQYDYGSPAFLQSRHYFVHGHNMHSGPIAAPESQNTSRFRDQDQSKPGPVNPVRTRTEPVLAPSSVEPTVQPDRPRRASEQAKRSFLHHQTANMLAQTPQNSGFQPALRRPAEQAAPPRLVLTPRQPGDTLRSAPPTDSNHSAKPLISDSSIRGGNMNVDTGGQAIKDKDLFGKQKYRAVPERQMPVRIAPESKLVDEHQAPDRGVNAHPKECHCEDEPQLPITDPHRPGNESPERIQDALGPLPDKGKAVEGQPATRAKKKTSWLVHQAGKMAGRQGN